MTPPSEKKILDAVSVLDPETVILSNPAVARFTPGPWRWWTSNSWRRLSSDDRNHSQDGAVLCPCVSRRDGHPDCIVTDADMALIAAAPDLYEGLIEACLQIEYLHAKFNPTGTSEALLARSNRVLAKARGEPT